MTGQEEFGQIQQTPYNPSSCIPNTRIYLVILHTCMHANARRSSGKGRGDKDIFRYQLISSAPCVCLYA